MGAVSPVTSLTVAAPAKVNLFLHVTGRHADGYHTIESAFALIDLADKLTLELRTDGEIERIGDVPGVTPEEDLSLRAARALQSAASVRDGVAISLTKRIPQGAGLGGGSSDAGSVLLALNRLWRVDWQRERLAEVARTLGADVPFFVGGENAIVRGIGERTTPVSLPVSWIALALPRAHVRTADIFAASELTRASPSAKIDVFSEGYGRNDLQAVTAARVPQVAEALLALSQGSANVARMSGSGACVFAAFAAENEARRALESLPLHIEGRLARTLVRHPLAEFA
jgi:4-diphosphocytidyl-2-C-methyl-D-erythritol kinase